MASGSPRSPEISKSRSGLPRPRFPRGVDLALEARKSRRRLYPVTALYSCWAAAVVAAALAGTHRPWTALAWYAAGLAAWTYVEYLAHRHVLHGSFPAGGGAIRRALHATFDHLHWEHHARPWDGDHINGTIKDTWLFVVVLFALAFLAPLETAPVFLAGVVQGYVIEEWIHHSVHFYDFRGRYFRYIKRHHLYHHSPRGASVGYGLTSGVWDVLRGTRIPGEARRLLYCRR